MQNIYVTKIGRACFPLICVSSSSLMNEKVCAEGFVPLKTRLRL